MIDCGYTASTIDRSRPLSFTTLGTGGSAAVPVISCVTDPAHACAACLDTMPGGTGAQSKNRRGNTCGILTVPQKGGGEAMVLVDCGKTFREQALEWFPKKGFRRIDACILTHHHADAIDGLDDLRAWTNQAAIERTIPIYCTRTTYDFISAGFAYLTNKKAASGGGSLPSFEWHIMPESEDWTICGVQTTPLPAHHGIYLGTTRKPLICLGFLFDSTLLYMSDVSYIPEETWRTLSRKLSLPLQTGSYSITLSVALPRLGALVIDASGLRQSLSHFGLPQAIATARRLGVGRTYFTDISHKHSHASYLAFSRAFEHGAISNEAATAKRKSGNQDSHPPLWQVREETEQQASRAHVYEGLDPRVEDLELWRERALEAVEEWAGGTLPGCWTRPACDGMTICWISDRNGKDARVWDDEYV
ncbi:MBL fold metallo-hydrolase [Sporobolomyces koalae]|uniref:MBL fold metallo-hydrolase n=1 Tax=Sporobolomyces koalae TaxID=500713 RepID=UPI00317DB239